MRPYGKELILDIHGCSPLRFSRESIENYFISLCNEIDMTRGPLYFWDYEGEPEEYAVAPSHLKGVSAIQFITTSNITIHTLDDLKRVYLNIFSCKDFNAEHVCKFSKGWFDGEIVNSKEMERI